MKIFLYVFDKQTEKDILKLVNTIIANTKGDGEKSGEDFWVKAEKHLRRRPAIVKPDEVFDYYEIDAADLPEDMET